MEKPRRFSDEKIWSEIIAPKELEEWLGYVTSEYYERLIQNDVKIQKNKICIRVRLHFRKGSTIGNDVNAYIDAEFTRPGNFVCYWDIAKFVSILDAKTSFLEYATFKSAKIDESEYDKYWSVREIDVAY